MSLRALAKQSRATLATFAARLWVASAEQPRNDSVKDPQLPALAVASAHPFVQQGRSIGRKAAILAIVIAVQVIIVFLYLYFTGRASVPYMLVPVTIIPATAH